MTEQNFNKWTLNFSSKVRGSDRDLSSPPGYTSAVSTLHVEERRETDPSLIDKRSWEIACGPVKQIPMNLFLMYMAGNSISIFPIMMVGMLFLRPIKAFLTVSTAFKQIEGDQHILQKLIYLLGNAGCIALALYKCQSMGLLPTHPSDWLEFLDPPEAVEFSSGGVVMS